jgi:hypothetical protein
MNSNKVVLCNLVRKDSRGHEFEIPHYFVPEDWIKKGRISGQEIVKMQDFIWKVKRVTVK